MASTAQVHPSTPWRPEVGVTAMTVAVVREPDVLRAPDAVVDLLAQLAVNDELVVVYGSDVRFDQPVTNAVVDGLRERLPRYTVVGLSVLVDSAMLLRTCAMLDEFMELGSLPVVVAPAAAVVEVATEYRSYLRADRMVHVCHGPTGEVDVYQAWHRDPTDAQP